MSFIIEDKTPRACVTIHAQIKGIVEVQFERYLDGLQGPQPYKCGSCGQEFTSPEDFRSTT